MINDKHGKNFIQAAEEYIRTGCLEEAIELLKEGIKTYPDYLSARISLAKAYIAKGMINEAMKEFEHVVRVSPDNLLAHRKLAFLYNEAGRVDSAIKSCESVLIFNSRDREILDLLRNLKSNTNENSLRQTGSDEHKDSSSEENVAPVIDFTSGWAVASEESKPDGLFDDFLTESMGDICIAQGEKAKGTEIFRKILQKDPDNESVRGKLINLGIATPAPVTVSDSVKKREQQTARLGDFLNRVKENRR